MDKDNVKRKLDLLLRAWLSDKDNCSDRACRIEEDLIKEIKEEVQE